MAPPPRFTRDATLATMRRITRVAFETAPRVRFDVVLLPERFFAEVTVERFATVRPVEPEERFAVDFLPEDDFPPVLRDAPALLFKLVRRTVLFEAARFAGAPALRTVLFDDRFATGFVALSFAVDFFAVARLVVRVDDFAIGFFAPVDFEDDFFADVLLDKPPLRAELFDEPPELLFFDVLRISS